MSRVARAGQGGRAADPADHLYGLPLDEFTPARDALARELRRNRDREGAEEVRAQRKPTAAAWVVNQLARRRRDELDELLQAGAALRDAQQRVLAGEGPKLLADAGREERAAIDRLVRRAGELLADGGGRPSAAVLERVAETLHAVASDEELRAEVERGRVLRERKAATFAGLALAPGGAKEREPAGQPGRAARETKKRKPTRQADREADDAEKRRVARAAAAVHERKQREQVKRSQVELRGLRGEHREAERAVTRAKRELERVVARAERELDQARTAHERAEQAVRDAERRLAELDGSG